MHCYRTGPTAEEWWKFCGVHSPGHGPKHPFEVKITAPKHEIMQGMSDWKTPQGELYFIKTAYSTMTPLAESLSKRQRRCIQTSGSMHTDPTRLGFSGLRLAHHNETMLEPNYMEMITRGLLGQRVGRSLKT